MMLRLTPTHVGNTFDVSSKCRPIQAHPHACGEYFLPPLFLMRPLDSPPRMWGIHSINREKMQAFRLTPTHVGNTSPRNHLLVIWWAHPHACGEYNGFANDNGDAQGSPPRMWGIHFVTNLVACRYRLTPTHVGNTSDIRAHRIPVKAHPHACGEYNREHQ